MTCGMLYELLDRLPQKCDGFMVKFVTSDRGNFFFTDSWSVDDRGEVFFFVHDDPEWEDSFSVSRVKMVVNGEYNDNTGRGVFNSSDVCLAGAGSDPMEGMLLISHER